MTYVTTAINDNMSQPQPLPNPLPHLNTPLPLGSTTSNTGHQPSPLASFLKQPLQTSRDSQC